MIRNEFSDLCEGVMQKLWRCEISWIWCEWMSYMGWMCMAMVEVHTFLICFKLFLFFNLFSFFCVCMNDVGLCEWHGWVLMRKELVKNNKLISLFLVFHFGLLKDVELYDDEDGVKIWHSCKGEARDTNNLISSSSFFHFISLFFYLCCTYEV